MQKPNTVRCVNKTTNKVRYFSRELAKNPRWRKHTGFEIQEIAPVESKPLLCEEVKKVSRETIPAENIKLPAKRGRKPKTQTT